MTTKKKQQPKEEMFEEFVYNNSYKFEMLEVMKKLNPLLIEKARIRQPMAEELLRAFQRLHIGDTVKVYNTNGSEFTGTVIGSAMWDVSILTDGGTIDLDEWSFISSLSVMRKRNAWPSPRIFPKTKWTSTNIPVSFTTNAGNAVSSNAYSPMIVPVPKTTKAPKGKKQSRDKSGKFNKVKKK